MRKYNGPELDNIILASHLRMMNFEALEKSRKPNIILDNISTVLAIGLMVYLFIR